MGNDSNKNKPADQNPQTNPQNVNEEGEKGGAASRPNEPQKTENQENGKVYEVDPEIAADLGDE